MDLKQSNDLDWPAESDACFIREACLRSSSLLPFSPPSPPPLPPPPLLTQLQQDPCPPPPAIKGAPPFPTHQLLPIMGALLTPCPLPHPPPTASPPPFPCQAPSPRLSSTIPHPMFNLLRQAALFEYIQLTAHPASGFQSLRGKLTCQKQLWSSRNLREKYEIKDQRFCNSHYNWLLLSGTPQWGIGGSEHGRPTYFSS